MQGRINMHRSMDALNRLPVKFRARRNNGAEGLHANVEMSADVSDINKAVAIILI